MEYDDDALQLLEEYIQKQVVKGFSEEEIKKKLQENGWPEDLITKFLK